MRIGYPTTNFTIGAFGPGTLKVTSFNKERLAEIIEQNLERLAKILAFNAAHDLLYYRLPPDLIPRASAEKNPLAWAEVFKHRLRELGDFIKRHEMRLAVHPELHVFINSPNEKVNAASARDLAYQALLLDTLGLDGTAKIQLHLGDRWDDHQAGVKCFIEHYQRLDGAIRRRLVIENDCVIYNLGDCLRVQAETGVPVVLDTLHRQVRQSGETLAEALAATAQTWRPEDGLPLVDYSSQKLGKMPGKHADAIDLEHFQAFLRQSRGFDFDVMIEIKDMERSALQAAQALRGDQRFLGALPAAAASQP